MHILLAVYSFFCIHPSWNGLYLYTQDLINIFLYECLEFFPLQIESVGDLNLLKSIDYCQVSNIRRTLVGNKIVDHSDVVGASPVGAAPTTSSFST